MLGEDPLMWICSLLNLISPVIFCFTSIDFNSTLLHRFFIPIWPFLLTLALSNYVTQPLTVSPVRPRQNTVNTQNIVHPMNE